MEEQQSNPYYQLTVGERPNGHENKNVREGWVDASDMLSSVPKIEFRMWPFLFVDSKHLAQHGCRFWVHARYVPHVNLTKVYFRVWPPEARELKNARFVSFKYTLDGKRLDTFLEAVPSAVDLSVHLHTEYQVRIRTKFDHMSDAQILEEMNRRHYDRIKDHIRERPVYADNVIDFLEYAGNPPKEMEIDDEGDQLLSGTGGR